MIKSNESIGAIYVTEEQFTARRKDPVTSKTDSLRVSSANPDQQQRPALSKVLLSQVTVGRLSREENDRGKRELAALLSRDKDYED
jgi:hypothetical protein